MDNLTHSLAGWALGQAGFKEKSRKGLAALLLGANAPDIDVFTLWVSWQPLATHRGITHSLVGGVVILPLLLWGLLLILDRWQVRRGAQFRSRLPMRPGWLLALCYLGTITHPLLDLQTTYSVQLFSPLNNLWYHADSLFIIDIWLWIALAGTILWSKRREAAGDPAYRRPVQAALAAAFTYICFNLGLSGTAVSRLSAREPQANAIFASPPPLAFWRRELSWREGDAIGRADWTLLGGLGPSKPLAPNAMNDPVVRTAIARDPDLRRFLRWSILPIAKVERTACLATVTIADGRYGLPGEGRARLFRETVVDVCT